MRFGLQKLTLLDYPGNVACTVFSCGCNFRCPYCHNAFLVTGSESGLELDFAGLLAFLEKRIGILDGVCFTGGEFLLHPDAVDAVASAKALGYRVKVDTNGSFPGALKELIDTGSVDYVAMDIKNTPEKYGLTIGCENFDILPVLKSVEILKQDKIPYEFRTTVVRELHTAEDFETIGKWLVGCEKYFLQAFTDSGDLIQDGLHACSKAEMEKMLDITRIFVPSAMLRGV